jgi:putative hemolysin
MISNVPPKILNKLKSPVMHPKPQRPMQPIAGAIPTDLLLKDFEAAELIFDTSPEREQKGMRVYRAIGEKIPNVLLELGRLREETFRTVGEGSGLDRDIDQFDPYYDHFVAWDKGKQEITGAYRIGRVDEILKKYGPKGLYTCNLFHFDELLETDFREGTLEAGRSFVRPEYQRGLSLLVIWMAFARFIMTNPHYKNMMGPVSISNEFQENSKTLMISYLMKNFPHEKSAMVSSKNPPALDTNLAPEELVTILNASMNLTALQEFVRHAEGNPKAQIPQLIKLYLELGVKFLAFNKDDEFNTIDGLIWLDITAVPEAVGLRYFGEGWKTYLAYHGK